MARRRVADERDGLQVWRTATNVPNKQSHIADGGWSTSLKVGRGANDSTSLKTACYEMLRSVWVIHVPQDRNKWSALLNTVMNFLVHKMRGIY
jgi:hypothetical protein